MWPADHAWRVAKDVASRWAGVGAGPRPIDELLADARPGVVRAYPWEDPPSYR